MGVVTKLVSLATERTMTPDTPYECKACGKGLSEQYHECPECGSYRVERREWELID